MATRRKAAGAQTRYNTNQNITYMYGSAAPKAAPAPQRTPVKRESVNPQIHKKARVQSKAVPVNKPLFVLTLAAFALIGAMMIRYISLNSEISVLTSGIASLESRLNTLQAENDEYRSRILSSVDLEKVREIAIMDLGMVYASEDQIITYDSQVDDYVEQSRVIKD